MASLPAGLNSTAPTSPFPRSRHLTKRSTRNGWREIGNTAIITSALGDLFVRMAIDRVRGLGPGFSIAEFDNGIGQLLTRHDRRLSLVGWMEQTNLPHQLLFQSPLLPPHLKSRRSRLPSTIAQSCEPSFTNERYVANSTRLHSVLGLLTSIECEFNTSPACSDSAVSPSPLLHTVRLILRGFRRELLGTQ